MPTATLSSPSATHTVQVWVSDVSSSFDVTAADGCLSPAENRLAARLTADERRRTFVAARHLAKRAVRELAEADILGVLEILSEDPTGVTSRPVVCVDGQPIDMGLSITHQDGVVAVAVSEGTDPPGIDLGHIEQSSQGFNEFWMTTDEQQQVAASDDPALTATMNWTAREAAFKATTLDTEFRPAHWSVLFDGSRATCFHRGQRLPLQFCFYRIKPTLLLTVASHKADVALHTA